MGGRCNFFGLLGFREGEQPVEIVRDTLDDHIKIRNPKGTLKKISDTSFVWEFDINIPSATEIYNITPLAWSSKSCFK